MVVIYFDFFLYLRFDDIYLGIVALKSHIEPLHNDEFYFHKARYTDPHSYKYVVASHGYSIPSEMLKVWSESRTMGFA